MQNAQQPGSHIHGENVNSHKWIVFLSEVRKISFVVEHMKIFKNVYFQPAIHVRICMTHSTAIVLSPLIIWINARIRWTLRRSHWSSHWCLILWASWITSGIFNWNFFLEKSMLKTRIELNSRCAFLECKLLLLLQLLALHHYSSSLLLLFWLTCADVAANSPINESGNKYFS